MFDALVLAAGFGSRLKPMTETIPKPLVPYFGLPLLQIAFRQLQSARRVYVNTHYHSDQVEDFSKSFAEKNSMDLRVLHEHEILGTGGPIASAHADDCARDLLIYNSDCIHSIELLDLLQFHDSHSHAATMVLLPDCPEGKNPVYAKNGQVIKIGQDPNLDEDPETSRHTLAGVHIVGSGFREKIPTGEFVDVRKIYELFFNSNESIGAFVYNKEWFDLGNPTDYWCAHQQILGSEHGKAFLKRIGLIDALENEYPDFRIEFGTKGHFELYRSSSPGSMTFNFSEQALNLSNFQNLMLLNKGQSHLLSSNCIIGQQFKIDL